MSNTSTYHKSEYKMSLKANLLLFASICLVLVLAEEEEKKFQGRLVNGTPTTIDKVPHLAKLCVDGHCGCGGTFLTSRWVATAAHCVYGIPKRSITVQSGTSYLSRKGVERNVDMMILPSEYKPPSMNWDVALIRLATPMEGNFKTMSLCSAEVPVGATVQTAGWGLTHFRGRQSEQVQMINVPRLPQEHCGRSYARQQIEITDTMMCASQQGNTDACMGDSGGPMTYNNELCGIVSFGIDCAHPNFPGIYTNVVKVKEFLVSNMQKYENAAAKPEAPSAVPQPDWPAQVAYPPLPPHFGSQTGGVVMYPPQGVFQPVWYKAPENATENTTEN